MRYVGISCARDHAGLVTKDKAGFMEQFKASPNDGTVIVPTEYRRLGCLQADQFIAALMEHRSARCYVGLLSAAQYHGAAHHRPQEL